MHILATSLLIALCMSTAATGAATAGAVFAQYQAVPLQSLSGSLHVVLKRHFLAKGTRRVDQTMPIGGLTLGSRGAFELGTGDTVLMHDSITALPPIGGSVSVRVQVMDLNWLGLVPLRVRHRGKDEAWVVKVGLPDTQEQVAGTMSLFRATTLGGFANFTLPVQAEFTYIGPNGEVQTERRSLDLSTATTPWTTNCPSQVLELPRLSGAICLGVNDSGGVTGFTMFSTPGDVSMFVIPAAPVAGVPPVVAPTATVDPTAILGSGVVVEDFAIIGPRTVIGPNATIRPSAQVGADATVGASAVLGKLSFVGDGAVVGDNSFIAIGSRVFSGAVLDDEVFVGDGSEIGPGAVVGSNSQIGDFVVVGADTVLKRNVTIDSGVTVPGGITLAAGTLVPASTSQTGNTFTCQLPGPGGGTFAGSIAACAAAQGVVQDCVPAPNFADLLNAVAALFGTPPAAPKGKTLKDLQDDVDLSGVAPANGGGTYTEDIQDCDDFADELEQFLDLRGWNATFTAYYQYSNPRRWYKPWTWFSSAVVLDTAHAVVDVHLPDGTTVWIEPQWSVAQGAIGLDLDFDGDGTVEFADSPGEPFTDDMARIEVYESAAAAAAAGAVVD